jgi:hypothetical protein
LFDSSDKLQGISATLKEILARLPSLKNEYRKTFREDPKSLIIQFCKSSFEGAVSLQVYYDYVYDKDSLFIFISALRDSYPILKKWCFEHASQDPDGSILSFCNLEKDDEDEFSGELIDYDFFTSRELNQINYGGNQLNKEKVIDIRSLRSNAKFTYFSEFETLNLKETIPPLVNIGTTLEPKYTIIKPVDSIFISEFSLKYMGMYLLSSIVRYRPQLWVNAISRTSFGDELPDDSALALIELFLSNTLTTFPKFIIQMIMRGNN